MIDYIFGGSMLQDLPSFAGLFLGIAVMYACCLWAMRLLERRGRTRSRGSLGNLLGIEILVWFLLCGVELVIFAPQGQGIPRGLPQVALFFLPCVVAGLGLVLVAQLLPARARTGPERTVNSWGSRLLLLMAPVLVLIGVCCAAAFVWWLGADDLIAVVLFGAVPTLIVFILLAVGCRNAAMRLLAGTLPTTVDGPTALYLRPFDNEQRPFLTGWTGNRTFEEFLYSQVARELGTMVALGNPTDRIAPKGAVRIYSADGDWQRKFETLALAATCVMGVTTTTSNTNWELTRIRQLNLHGKLFLLSRPPELRLSAHRMDSRPRRSRDIWTFTKSVGSLPFNEDARVRAMTFRHPPASFIPSPDEPWADVAATLRDCGYRVDVDDPGAGAVLGFDETGTLQVLATEADTPRRYVQPIVASISSPDSVIGPNGESQSAAGPGSVRPVDTAQLLRTLGALHHESLLVGPTIPDSKIQNCRGAFGIPPDEDILGIVDFTVLSNAKRGIVITTAAVYVLTGPVLGTRLELRLAELDACHFELASSFDEFYLGVGDGRRFRVAGDARLAALVLEVLEDVQRQVRR